MADHKPCRWRGTAWKGFARHPLVPETLRPLTERIQEDRIIAYVFRRTWAQWQAALPDRAFPALPTHDKACAALFWRLVEADVLVLEIDDDNEVARILPGPKFGRQPKEEE